MDLQSYSYPRGIQNILCAVWCEQSRTLVDVKLDKWSSPLARTRLYLVLRLLGRRIGLCGDATRAAAPSLTYGRSGGAPAPPGRPPLRPGQPTRRKGQNPK